MTPAQREKFYFPAFNRMAWLLDWTMAPKKKGGRLIANIAAQRVEFAKWHEPAREVVMAVLDAAESLAAQQHRAVTDEDLRHGCNMVATGGRLQSSDDFDNKQTNRVVNLFNLLRDPENLDYIMAWLHPEESDRKNLVAYMRKLAPDGPFSAISKNAFGTIFWEDLDAAKLKWLLKTVKPRTQPAPTSDPF